LELDEQHIRAALVEGRQDAFEKMFKAWYNPLCNYAYGFLSSKDESEETVQNVFTQLWEKRKEITIETSLKSYLYRAVRNSSLNVLKHQKVKKEHATHTLRTENRSHESVTGKVIAKELEQRIEEAMMRLPEQCRLVFRLSRFEELKYGEIADQLNISVKTVENQMGKALRIMREELSEYLPLIAILLAGLLE